MSATATPAGQQRHAHRRWYVLGLLIALAVALPRLNGGHTAGDYLWAEDGNLFLEQARALGWRSLWTPYAGYLHLYPRLFAYLASQFDLHHAGRILGAGWLLSWLALAAVMLKRALALGLPGPYVLLFLAVTLFQPNNSEVFFNITNSQWHIGAALTLFVLTSTHREIAAGEYIVLLVFGLTGPFSVLLLPLLGLHFVLFRGRPRNYRVYGVLACCGLLQAGVLMASSRLAAVASTVPAVWLGALRSVLLFGTDTPYNNLIALVFWAILMTLFVVARAGRKTALLLIAAALLHLTAALYAWRAEPALMVATGTGNRYTWIPYCLLFFAALTLAARARGIGWLVLLPLPLMWIDYAGFRPLQLGNLQFASYANLARYVDVVAPLNPVLASYPGWYIRGGPGAPVALPARHGDLHLDQVSVSGAALQPQAGDLVIEALGNDPALYFREHIDCGSATDIGIEIRLRRADSGWVQVFWAEQGAWAEKASLRRFYPAGDITAQFAFPNGAHGWSIRLDPHERPGVVRINNVHFYCLP